MCRLVPEVCKWGSEDFPESSEDLPKMGIERWPIKLAELRVQWYRRKVMGQKNRGVITGSKQQGVTNFWGFKSVVVGNGAFWLVESVLAPKFKIQTDHSEARICVTSQVWWVRWNGFPLIGSGDGRPQAQIISRIRRFNNKIGRCQLPLQGRVKSLGMGG